MAAGLAIALISSAPTPSGASFVNFESGHVRPLALVNDLLFAVDTPDNRLVIFKVVEEGLKAIAEISVGLEPVAVAARNVICLAGGICPYNVWVVNHLSDSVTVIDFRYDTDKSSVEVTKVTTLQTCDEPRDVVLAGPDIPKKGPGRAFITAARRGQSCPIDANLSQEGLPRGVVHVFDTETLGKPIANILLFTDAPRGLAVSPDRKRVYAAGFLSGNQTTAILEPVVAANGGLPPVSNVPPPGAPSTGLIVKYNSADKKWEEDGLRPLATTPKDWSSFVKFKLPDLDVFAIDALASPSEIKRTRKISEVGTVLFNLAVRPKWNLPFVSKVTPTFPTDQIFVSNTEAFNQLRFEPTLLGHIAESRITIISGTTTKPKSTWPGLGPFVFWEFDVNPVHLNPHVNYTCKPPCVPLQSEIDESLAMPTDMVFSTDGKRLYAAAFGSGAVAIYDAEQLSQGNPKKRKIVRVGGGPSGLALDEVFNRLYVMDRFSNTIRTIELSGSTPSISSRAKLYDPSPDKVRKGRRFLYDAYTTSAHGDNSCASCHIFGDFDGLAWDLGNPLGNVETNCNDFVNAGPGFSTPIKPVHPMKGPMTTQSLRGMEGHGPLHWRGDRSGCGSTVNAPPNQGQYNVDAGFKKFNGAFVSLLGRKNQLSTAPGDEMDQFTDFAMTIAYPPNPIRPFEGLSPEAVLGETFFLGQPVDKGLASCDFCHKAASFGTNAKSSEEFETQQFKIAHLRNLYQKVGMFGVPDTPPAGFIPTGFTGDQVRGFGYLHDGSVDTVSTFLHAEVFQFPADDDRKHVEKFLFEFDTGLAPIVGQQRTSTVAKPADLSTLLARADASDCDLVARGVPDPALGGREKGYWYHMESGDSTRWFYPDLAAGTKLSSSDLLATIKGKGWFTFTCVPPGSGRRIGIDRDCDNVLDGDESPGKAPNAITQYPSGLCP